MKQKDILIVDYDLGNVSSISNALDFLGYTYEISNKKENIKKAKAFILPGVGAFGEAMNNLKHLDLIESLENQVLENYKPILGICLGMQIMADSSEEKGYHKGLGWINGKVKKLQAHTSHKIPHVGWNSFNLKIKQPLFNGLADDSNFYFDHSYAFMCDDKYASAKISHTRRDFAAAVQKNNIFGVQFHPERSQNSGLKVIRNFFNYIRNNS